MPKEKENTLHGLLLIKLMALYDIESNIVKMLPKIEKKASDPRLSESFARHREETKNQIERLRQCFELLGAKPKKLKSAAIRGLAEDANWIMQNIEAGPPLDVSLIAAAQYVEHYEIAGYGSACEWAKLMKHNEVQKLLRENLAEEERTDKQLTSLAISSVNEQIDPGM